MRLSSLILIDRAVGQAVLAEPLALHGVGQLDRKAVFVETCLQHKGGGNKQKDSFHIRKYTKKGAG